MTWVGLEMDPGSSAAPADEVVEQIRKLGGEAVANYDSVATPQGGEAIVRKAIEAFGRVDILINNAGILRDKTMAKMEPPEWDSVISVHLDGAYNVTRPAFMKMRENGFGRIIMTTSASGLYGNFGQANYSAAKMGLVGLMNTLKLEGEKHNIKVNAVAPMAITRLTEDVLPADLSAKTKPEFIAPMVLYLCSENCAENGMIFNAGAGTFNRVAVWTTPGVVVGDGQMPPTPEQIHQAWDRINNLASGEEYYNATAALGSMLQAFEPKKQEPASGGRPTVQAVFDTIGEAFQPEKASGVNVVFQFRISGSGGGEWYTIIKEGVCQAARGPTRSQPQRLSCRMKIFSTLSRDD